ncbi:hypothetical protein C8Q75DRAFT_202480 [Abortiporus biennis]|nr:hypothetical protein C8Q75DRAFT_202480 [Abortiporus biennis]
MLILPFLLALPLVLAADTLRLHHRIYHPSAEPPPFTERGALTLSQSRSPPSASLVHSETFKNDFQQFASSIPTENLDLALYQVALQREGDQDQSSWHISAVKACHLLHATSESITLHLSADGVPFAIDYFVDPVPHDGSCAKRSRSKKVAVKPLNFKPVVNSTVLVRPVTFPPLPQLRTPPPLTQEGKPVEPVPEKSFLQKYWIYIVVAIAALALSPTPPEEENGGRTAAQR